MVRIDPNNRIVLTPPARSATSARAEGFKLPETPKEPQASAPQAMAAATSLDALLALQGVEERPARRRRVIRRGRALLDGLDEIRLALLSGGLSDPVLDRMEAVLAEARERGEKGLDALLDDVELRVRVELAKRGRFPPG